MLSVLGLNLRDNERREAGGCSCPLFCSFLQSLIEEKYWRTHVASEPSSTAQREDR
jgi:hypothetical protein